MEKVKEIFKESIGYIMIIIIVLLLKAFIIAPIRVNGTSMNNTLKDKDIMILNKVIYNFSDIKRFDIVVINEDSEKIIKRVIGLPGDEIEYIDNVLYVNGKKVAEKFSHKKTEDFNLDELEASIVPKDSYFVLGDNRTNSLDSRIIGFIPKERIMGKATITLYPFSRFGRKK